MSNRMGPISTNTGAYLPPGYSELAYPAYPQQPTHKTKQPGTLLFNDISGGQDSVVDSLSENTEVIVFKESCGELGRYSEVIVYNNRYDGDISPTETIPLKKLYVLRETLEKLPGTKKSHPIVSPDKVAKSYDTILPSNWREKTPEVPFYDTRTAYYCVTVERRWSGSRVEDLAEEAIEIGLKKLLDNYEKNYRSELLENYKDYFNFVRAESYYAFSRQSDFSNVLKFLIIVPQIYFDVYPRKSSRNPITDPIRDVEREVDKWLNENDGTINDNLLREAIEQGVLDERDWRNEERTIEVYGEEVVVVEEDLARRALFSPEELAEAIKKNNEALNQVIGDLPEDVYNRFVPGEVRDAIDDTREAISEAFAAAGETADDVTEALQSTINTINTVTQTLNNAPDVDSVNDALVAALTDPSTDMSNLSENVVAGSISAGNLKREALKRDLSKVIENLEGTLILKKYSSLIDLTAYAERNPPSSDPPTDNIVQLLLDEIAFLDTYNSEEYGEGVTEEDKNFFRNWLPTIVSRNPGNLSDVMQVANDAGLGQDRVRGLQALSDSVLKKYPSVSEFDSTLDSEEQEGGTEQPPSNDPVVLLDEIVRTPDFLAAVGQGERDFLRNVFLPIAKQENSTSLSDVKSFAVSYGLGPQRLAALDVAIQKVLEKYPTASNFPSATASEAQSQTSILDLSPSEQIRPAIRSKVLREYGSSVASFLVSWTSSRQVEMVADYKELAIEEGFGRNNFDALSLAISETSKAIEKEVERSLGEALEEPEIATNDVTQVTTADEVEQPVEEPSEPETVEGRTVEEYAELIEELEESMKQIDFYASYDDNEFYNGTLGVSAILDRMEQFKSDFKGKVKGWNPALDSKRIKKARTKIIEIINKNGLFWTPEYFTSPDFVPGDKARLEIGFTRNHKVVYVGYEVTSVGLGAIVSEHYFGEELEDVVRGNAPLDSETVMAYVWKLNDIIQDPLSTASDSLVRWGNRYVYPRPRFIAKPQTGTDITAQRKANNDEILRLTDVERDRNDRENVELRVRQAIEAINYVEAAIDTGVVQANDVIDDINSVDDVFNDFVDSVAANNPYVGAALKCVVPTLDFDLLPEIPDIDLQRFRNPLLKLLELVELIIPPDIFKFIADNWLRILEQIVNVLYLTAIKMLLETLEALCLQAQSLSLAGIAWSADKLLDPDSEEAAAAGFVSNKESIKNSALYNSLVDTGIIGDSEDQLETIRKMKLFFADVGNLLTPIELCRISMGKAPEYVLDLTFNLMNLKHKELASLIQTKSRLVELFADIGKHVDMSVCDELIQQLESRENYADSYKQVGCEVSEQLDQVRKNILDCHSSLDSDTIDKIIAEENKNKLEVVKTLINNINDTSNYKMPKVSTKSKATDHFDNLALNNFYNPIEESMERETKEFFENLKTLSENYTDPLTLTPVLQEDLSDISKSTEIIYDNLGIEIKLKSPSTERFQEVYRGLRGYVPFEISYRIRNKKKREVDPFSTMITGSGAFQEFNVDPLTAINDIESKKNRFYITLNNSESGQVFSHNGNYELSEESKNYLNTLSDTLDSEVTPQQIYFYEIISKNLNVQIRDVNKFKNFVQYGCYTSVVEQMIQQICNFALSSELFDFSNTLDENSRFLTNLETIQLSDSNLYDLSDYKKEIKEFTDENKDNDKPGPSDGAMQRKSFKSFEIANIEQCVNIFVKTYLLEFYLKSIFVNGNSGLFEEQSDVAIGYVLEKMKKEIPENYSRIFNYKFYYLTRGIYQDKKKKLKGADFSLNNIFKQIAVKQNKIIKESLDAIFTRDRLIPDLRSTLLNSLSESNLGGFYYNFEIRADSRAYSKEQFLQAIQNNLTFNKVTYNASLEFLLPSVTEQGTLGIVEIPNDNVQADSKESKFKINYDSVLNTGTSFIANDERENPNVTRSKIYSKVVTVEKEITNVSYETIQNLQENEMIAMIQNTTEAKVLFDYIFSISNYKDLIGIFCNESINNRLETRKVFEESRERIRTLFNIMDSRGKFDYDPSDLDNFKKISERKLQNRLNLNFNLSQIQPTEVFKIENPDNQED